MGYLLEGWSRSPPISGWATSSSRTGGAGCEPGDLVTNRDVLTPLDLGRVWSGTLEGDGCHLIYLPERLCGWCPGGLGWLGRRCSESRGLPRTLLPGPDEGQWEMMGEGVLLRSAQTWEIFWHWTCRSIGASLVAHKVSACNAGDLGLIPESGRSPGEGTSLQYSCLENSMDREAWQAIVHGVAKNWTGLSN